MSTFFVFLQHFLIELLENQLLEFCQVYFMIKISRIEYCECKFVNFLTDILEILSFSKLHYSKNVSSMIDCKSASYWYQIKYSAFVVKWVPSIWKHRKILIE